jgi:hypothetical protein
MIGLAGVTLFVRAALHDNWLYFAVGLAASCVSIFMLGSGLFIPRRHRLPQ